MRRMKEKVCELCYQRASLYCASDSAFLCWKCDDAVHGANFLVARHIRRLLCSSCDSVVGIHVAGAKPRRAGSTCRSCSPVENLSLDDAGSLRYSSSSASACVSCSEPRVATSAAEKKIESGHAPGKRKRIRTRRSCTSSVTDDDDNGVAYSSPAKRRGINGGDGDGSEEEEAMFAKWIEELGLGLNGGDRVSSLASRALNLCLERWKGVPLRVAAAASFWLGVRFCGIATFQNLWKLEAVSGVPAKLILTAHSKLPRVFIDLQPLGLEEGCDES